MDAIINKYGYKEGLETEEGNITAWPYKEDKPTAQELKELIKKHEASITYLELRKKEYPRIEEQLDMIFHDKVNGTNEWQALIGSIKTKYPKPI